MTSGIVCIPFISWMMSGYLLPNVLTVVDGMNQVFSLSFFISLYVPQCQHWLYYHVVQFLSFSLTLSRLIDNFFKVFILVIDNCLRLTMLSASANKCPTFLIFLHLSVFSLQYCTICLILVYLQLSSQKYSLICIQNYNLRSFIDWMHCLFFQIDLF